MPQDLMEAVSVALEVLGAAVIVAGLVLAAGASWRSGPAATRFSRVRSTMGRAILLGLEVLVAADIIRTVAVTPTLASVLVLGLVVLIRTFLSFSLSVEIEGALPWRRAADRSSREG